MPRKRLLKTNKQALRWCNSRRAVAKFTDWIEEDTGKLITQCEIHIGKRKRVGRTLLKAVNTWIQHFNGDG